MKGHASSEACGPRPKRGRGGQIGAGSARRVTRTRELTDAQLVAQASRDLVRARQYTSTRNYGVMGDDDYDTCARRCGHSIGPGDRFQQVIIDGAPRRQHLDCPGRT